MDMIGEVLYQNSNKVGIMALINYVLNDFDQFLQRKCFIEEIMRFFKFGNQ